MTLASFAANASVGRRVSGFIHVGSSGATGIAELLGDGDRGAYQAHAQGSRRCTGFAEPVPDCPGRAMGNGK